ncbi:MAG: hypothetical protein J6A38_05010 [Clostridia bacterium]|nr:hypothetical protein [Clostridia bacterium]
MGKDNAKERRMKKRAEERQPPKQPAPKQGKVKQEPKREYSADMPSQLHCPRCKTLMDKGVCPHCGHYVYVPMDKGKVKKIKLVLTVVALIAFVAIFAVIQSKK